MTEKLLNNKKNGMAVMLLTIALYLAAVALTVFGGMKMDEGRGWAIPLFVLGIVWLCVGWIPVLGLKVLRPQEALVLTLFGKYMGTLREAGFFFVHPFSTAINI